MVFLCGCYHTVESQSGRINQYLPQVNVAAHTVIRSMASSTTLTQIFHNTSSTDNISECTYLFPLYDGVSVTSFTCEVGSRVIKGFVEEKAKARQTYEEAVKCGETAGLLEQGPTSDVFTVALGNIPAGAELIVKISYVGELKHDMGIGGIRFTLPMVISPRYGYGQAQATMSSSAASTISITVDINMPTECAIQEVKSPSHPIGLKLGNISTSTHESFSSSKASATLSLATSILEKDFILEVLHKDIGKPLALLECHPEIPDQRAIMATLVPLGVPNKGPMSEIIIVADQSGSMRGGRTKTLVSALHILLKSLPVGISFNVCAFGSTHNLLWDKSRMYDHKSLVEAIEFIDLFDANYGGTETFAAVQAAIESRDPHQSLSLILATDGDIWQQDQLFSYLNDQVAQSKTSIRVFPLGIGNSVSSALVEGVARAGNGFAQTVVEGEKQDSKIVRMLKGALTANSENYTMEVQYTQDSANDDDDFVLVERVTDSLRVVAIDDDSPEAQLSKELATSTKDVSTLEQPDITMTDIEAVTSSPGFKVQAPKLLQTPQAIPPLYPNSRTTIYILLSPAASHLTPSAVVLHNNSSDAPITTTIPVTTLAESDTTIHSLAAKHAIHSLEQGRGWLHHAKAPSSDALLQKAYPKHFQNLVTAEAVRLGLQYQIAGKYTSFVAVESSTDSPSSASIKRPPPPPPMPAATPTTFVGRSRSSVRCYESYGGGADRSRNSFSSSFGSPSGYGTYSVMNFRSPVSSSPFHRTINLHGAPEASDVHRGSAMGDAGGRGGYPFGAPSQGGMSGGRGGPSPINRTGGMKKRRQHNPVDPFGTYEDAEPSKENKDLAFSVSTGSSTQTPQKPRTTPIDPLQRIIALQTFVGYWVFNDELLDAVGVSKKHETPEGTTKMDIWATVLAIAFLEERLGEEKEAWEMVAEKGRGWLDVQGFNDGVGGGKWWSLARKLVGEGK